MIGLVLAAALALVSPEPSAAALAPADLTPPRPEQLMAMPDALRQRFRQYVLSRGEKKSAHVDWVVDFLFRPEGLGMVYRHDATYTVAEAFQTRTANCLTFTLLTVALAREVGLEAYGQQIAKSLSWRREGNTIYRTIHVNAGIRLARRRLSVDVAWDQVIAGDPPEKISDARLFAHYYNNRSVELMEAGQLELARQHAEHSLALDPEYATSWSNAGVLQLRAGQLELAERDYRHALALDPTHAGALINLSAHYHRIGEHLRARPFIKRLASVQQRDPLHQFILALDFEKRGELRQAVTHLQRAIRLYDGEYRFHSGLARVYAQLGDARRAARALERARQLIVIAAGGVGRADTMQPEVPKGLTDGEPTRRDR